MEGLRKVLEMVPKDPNLGSSGGVSALSSDQSRVLVNTAPRQAVSVWTCSKLCAVFFTAGVIVGYTLKRRVRRWASNLLKRMKDD